VSPESWQLAEAWLVKAEHDLAVARLLVREEKRLLDVAAYHCQQAAEKALKAYLTAREIIFPKTHVLEKLLDLCLSADASFEGLRSDAKPLTPLADEFRYPADASEPTPGEAEQASAEEIYNFCAGRLRSAL
jgi:HEPN domain-containing protein